MKTITFFMLLVGIWGCESKSQSRNKEIPTPKQLSRAETVQPLENKNFNRERFERVINRIEYEIIINLLSNALKKTTKGKNVVQNIHFKNALNEFKDRIPLNDSDSWKGVAVKNAFYEIAKKENGEVEYQLTERYVKSLERLKLEMPSHIIEDKNSVIKYFTKPQLLYQAGFLPLPKVRFNPIGKLPIQPVVQSIYNDKNKVIAYTETLTAFINQMYASNEVSKTADTLIKVKPTNHTDMESDIELKSVEKDNSGYAFGLILFLVINILCVVAYYFFSQSKHQMAQKKPLIQKINELSDKISFLELELAKRINYSDNKKQTPIPNEYQNRPSISEISENPQYVMYAGRPDKNGVFTELEEKFIEGKTFYRLDINFKNAFFKIEYHPKTIASLLTYPEILLNPLCEEMNALLPTTKAIITEKDGEGHARLDEEKQVWRVTQKAKIRYLSEDELEAYGLKKQEDQAEENRLLKIKVEELTKRVVMQEKKDSQVTKIREVVQMINGFKNEEALTNNDSIKYAGTPNKDGSFNELKNKFIEGESYYCFDVMDKKAIFWVDDSPVTAQRLIAYPYLLLESVCEEINKQMPNHKNIITEFNGEGQAQWDSSKQVWKVTQKAKIKYT